jgi:hypothetical protein
MNEGCTVFAQVCAHAPTSSFRRCVTRYGAERYVKSFSCWDQFLCMVFAQFTHRESLRDIEACLRSLSGRLYQLGVRGKVSRSTLADANECRDWRTYADFAQVLIGIARRLYRDEAWAIDLAETVYAFDSTTIDLCLALFPWAPFQKGKAAIKLHTLLDLRGNIPTVIHITHGRIGDVSMLPALTAEPNSFYVFDRGYMDFEQLYRFHQGHAFFVVRAWKNLQFRRRYSRAADRPAGVQSDQTVLLTGKKSAHRYPDPLRRIHYRDPESACDLVFLTNNFELPAVTVAALYKSRWQVELFFRWIKQHLRIRKFFGISENAVKTQVWTAVSAYVLAAIAKKRLGLERVSLYTFLQVIGVTVFEKTPILRVFDDLSSQPADLATANQLSLFDF